MKKAIPVLVAIVLIIIIAGITFGSKVIEKYSYSDEEADLYEYFGITKSEEVPVILQDAKIDEKAVMADGRCYFELSDVHTYLNDRFYVDPVELKLLYTTPTEIYSADMNASSYTAPDGEKRATDYKIWFARTSGENTVFYVALDYVKLFTNFFYEVYGEPAHMQMYTRWDEQQLADVKKDTAVRLLGGVKSPILRKLNESETVVILDQMETWCKIKTEDAFIGYVENKFLENERTVTPEPVADYAVPEYTSLTEDRKIAMGFHAIYATSGNDTLKEVAAGAPGMNVIAPTWFSLQDNQGNLQSFATASYVEKAHGMGLEVWGVVDDFNYKNNKNADVDLYTILSATTTRTYLIDRIMELASECGMDGVNIDFETVNADSGEHFVQFLRELSIRCRESGLVLSVDNYVPYHFNSYYDLGEQGAVLDYVIIMGYDEHWAGSPEAGSVASIGYVRYGIEKASEYVPSKKLINALPFYTRLWKTAGTQVSSEAYQMAAVNSVLSAYGMESSWDEETGQNYAEATVGDNFYQMWIEDSQSIAVKLNVMQNYDLGGVAAWRLGFETPEIWSLIGAYAAQ